MSPLPLDLAAALTAWALPRPEIEALVLIGSHVRDPNDVVRRADAHSDWDFHVITSQPGMFGTRGWLAEASGSEVWAYSVSTARVGGVPRVAAVLATTEMDLVILPADAARAAREGMSRGAHLQPGPVRQALQDLAIVIRPGWRFLKPNPPWEEFYRNAVDAVPDPRIENAAAVELAEGFVCHWVSIGHRIERGELRAALRFMQRELLETNFRLLHELRLRRGEATFPEARRIERVAGQAELDTVTVDGDVTRENLLKQAAKCRQTLIGLMRNLVGSAWKWPLPADRPGPA